MLVSFNPAISNNKSNRQSPNFKSLQNGLIEATEVANYAKATLLPKIIKAGGGYKPTAQNFAPNLNALEVAKKIAAKDKSVGASIIDYLDEATEVLKEEAKRLGIIK